MAARPKLVAHVLGPSKGGIRRHVSYLAEHPPPGYSTLGVWGPVDLAPRFRNVPFYAAGTMSWLRAGAGADVIHAHGFGPGLGALRPGRKAVVLTVHIDLYTQGRTARSRLLRGLARASARRADAVIAVSERAARPFPTARVIPPAFAPLSPPSRGRSEVRAELGTPQDRVVVVSVGRLHPDKAHDLVIDAVGAAAAEGWICGEGPLREELSARAAGTSVRLLGHRDDIPDLLGAADVFALPSAGEAYGIAVVEAIAAGLPVVVSDAGAMPEIAGDAAVVVRAGDRAGFAAAIARLVSDPTERRRLAERARAVVLPEPDDLVRRVGAVYDEVTA